MAGSRSAIPAARDTGIGTEFFLPPAPCTGSRQWQLTTPGIFFLFYFFHGASYIIYEGKRRDEFQERETRMLKKIISTAICCHFLWNMFSCAPDAPRSNPLDPELNTAASRASISGAVFTRYQPASPLENAAVQLLPGRIMVLTGRNGSFQFSGLNPGSYQLIAQKEGYVADTVAVAIAGQEGQSINFFLNALPQIQSVTFYSEHIAQWWPGDAYRAFLTLTLSDPDGSADLDWPIFLIPAFGFSKTFQQSGRPDSFFVEIENLELPQSSLQHLIEQESYVTVTDRAGARVSGGPFFLRRIIEDAPLPLSPSNLQPVSAFPTLEWEAFSLAFEFTFVVQVFRISAGLPVLIHTAPGLPEEQVSYSFPDSLGSGTYFWTIGVRDNLNNFSRSKEASFIVP